MNKLTKKYKVVADSNKKLQFPVTEEGFPSDVYPGEGTIFFESDIYQEAIDFVNENGLVWEEPTYDPDEIIPEN